MKSLPIMLNFNQSERRNGSWPEDCKLPDRQGITQNLVSRSQTLARRESLESGYVRLHRTLLIGTMLPFASYQYVTSYALLITFYIAHSR